MNKPRFFLEKSVVLLYRNEDVFSTLFFFFHLIIFSQTLINEKSSVRYITYQNEEDEDE